MAEEKELKKEKEVSLEPAEKAESVSVDEPKEKKTKKKKKGGKTITNGSVFVKATFNNTIVSITDLDGNVIASCSAGVLGYGGSKKSTPYVAGLISNNAATKAKSFGMSDVNVFVKGIGSGRESAVRGLQAAGLNIISIKDLTPLPHNGCKKPRVRRV